MRFHGRPARCSTQASKAFQSALTAGVAEYMRALASKRGACAACGEFTACTMPAGSAKTQFLPQAHALGFFEHEGAECDVREREAAVPEQIGFVIALTPRLEAG